MLTNGKIQYALRAVKADTDEELISRYEYYVRKLYDPNVVWGEQADTEEYYNIVKSELMRRMSRK